MLECFLLKFCCREKAGRQHVEKLLMEGERVMSEREGQLMKRSAQEHAGLQRSLQVMCDG